MAEMDAFERRVVDTLAWYAEDVSLAVDAAAVAHRVALEHPRRRARVRAWVPAEVPRLAWLLLLTALLLTALIGVPFMLHSSPSALSWLNLIILGVFQLGLSYVFYATAIKHITALEAILILVIEPILNPVWVFLVIGEAPGPYAMIGGAIVLAAVTGRYALSALRQKRPLTFNQL